MPFHINQDYQVISGGSVAFSKRIQIDLDTWNSCDDDVQTGVTNILNAPRAIKLLSAGGKGNGIKQEAGGLEFHTQTNMRLQFPEGTFNDETYTFNQYAKGWGPVSYTHLTLPTILRV